jgi:carbamoyltransferase
MDNGTRLCSIFYMKGWLVRILGIFDDHNCGCAVTEGGDILAAIEEERLSRIKLHNGTTSDGPPHRSLRGVLEMTGSGRSNIDRIALAIEPPGSLMNYVLRDLLKDQRNDRWTFHSLFSTSVRWDRYFLFYSYWYNWHRIRKAKQLLRRFDLDGIPIQLVDHHLAHAAPAYYTSGKDAALIVTLDGQGDGLSGSIYHGENGTLTRVAGVSSFHSIGLFYNFITWMLGYKPNRHEGKITGLAAFGDAERSREEFARLFHMDGHHFRYDLAGRVLHHAYPHQSNYPKFLKATNGVLDGFSPADIAAGVQILSEECTQKFVSFYLQELLKKRKGRPVDVCLAGGVFSNVKINQRVAELPGVNSVFIFPAMMDAGLCVGGALWTYYQNDPEARKTFSRRRLRDVYLGPEYSEKEIEKNIRESGLEFEFVPDIEDRIGALLADGKVVARFNGRMEYGPRALGNRSILYQTTDPTVNDWLNKKLKRTEFMPFAPSTIQEECEKLYINILPNRFPAEYMTITFDCTPLMKRSCPATVHVDGTARPQIVYSEINPSYHRIIKAYQKRTGLSTIVNTSYNMHEEPIVCSPNDAIRAFKLGHLDYLAMHRFLVHPAGRS